MSSRCSREAGQANAAPQTLGAMLICRVQISCVPCSAANSLRLRSSRQNRSPKVPQRVEEETHLEAASLGSQPRALSTSSTFLFVLPPFFLSLKRRQDTGSEMATSVQACSLAHWLFYRALLVSPSVLSASLRQPFGILHSL